MALTKSDIPELMLAGLKTEFDLAYRSQLDNSLAAAIATTVNTTVPVQNYAWLSFPPPMREFIDERRPSGLKSYSLSIEDKVFESTLAIDRRAIEDDQLDLIRFRIKDLAQRVVQHRHQILVEKLLSGRTAPGPDGQAMFGEHTVGSQTQENSLTDSLNTETLRTAISTMMAFQDESDTPLGVMPDTLLVGPANYWTALELVESQIVVAKSAASAGTPYKNVLQGRLNVVVSPFISGNNSDLWFLMDTSRPVRSLILQQRSDVPVEFTALDSNSGSESAFIRDRYYYGVRGRYNVGFGLWQFAFAGGNA
ncbi:MAG: Mu-like prophage major head subunit gpT family protein [Armatimonadetes bacterium]|nr:Mu-like prophage major head subunit gpT family protein [Armatimonadota bacterium]